MSEAVSTTHDRGAPASALTINVFTEWNTPLGDSIADMDKHNAFAAFAIEAIGRAMPDLLRFLNDSGAKVIVGRYLFSFSIPKFPNMWTDVPEMAAHLNFLPWAEPHETMH